MKICMKGKKNTIQILILSSLFFTFGSKIAYAGSINGNEARVLNNMSAAYEYEGKSYKMSSGYIQEARAYFSQDGVELSAEDAQEVLNIAFSNIAQGVADGYLIEMEQTTVEEKSEKTGSNKIETSKLPQSEETVENQDKVEIKEAVPQYSMKTNEEKSEIEVKDSDGKKVLSLPVVIKNTGFSIRKTMLFSYILVIIGIVLLIVTAKRYLFAPNNDE